MGNVVKAEEAAIRAAAEHLRAGKLVAFPTETVYGLGADATNGQAVARVFAAKGRPRFNPLIVHVLDLGGAGRHAVLTTLARRLIDAFWPGPLTLVLDKLPGSELSDLVTGGLDTLAVRAPDHPVARALLKEVGRPLAAPSANRSGHVSPTQAAHVAADLGDRIAMILDGGATAFGLESTIIDARGDVPILLRPGAIAVETIAAVLDILGDHLAVSAPDASFYLWPEVPFGDTGFARELYAQENVIVLPGRFLARDGADGNPGINRVRIDDAGVHILQWADIGHLADLPPQPVYDQSKVAQPSSTEPSPSAA